MTLAQSHKVTELKQFGWTVKEEKSVRLNNRFYSVVIMWDGMGTEHTLNHRGTFGGLTSTF